MGVVEEHVAHLVRLRRRPRGVYARERALRRLEDWITPTGILEAHLDELRSFISRPMVRKEGTRGVWAIRNEVNHLCDFYRWAVLEDLRLDNPTLRLERPPAPEPRPRPMPDDAVQYALKNATERILPWLHLAAYCGLRACEVGPVRGEHVEGDWLWIPEQKGGEEGYASIHPAIRPLIDTWPRHGYLFPHRGHGLNGPTTAAQVSKLANLWLHAQGITHTFHTLRHWYGTKVRIATGDLLLVQRALRVKSLETARIYTEILDDEVAAGVAKIPDLTSLGIAAAA